MLKALSVMLLSIAAGLIGIASGPARAAYPDKPITMLVAYSPGGGTDIIARVIAPYIEKYLGNDAKIVVLNRTGAGGAIGFAALADAVPDGYTIGFINTPPVLTIPIERQVSFLRQSFDLLGNVIDDPGNFSVHADSPIKSLSDLAAFAKLNPGVVSVGTQGVGAPGHLAMLFFERTAGVKMNHIPFKGSGEVRAALAGKQITVGTISVGEALQFSKGGTPLRHLGQMSVSRTGMAPTLPTFKEQGFDIVMASLRGIAAPKGLPAPLREQLVRAVERAANDPQFQAQVASNFAPMRYLPPAKYEVELRDAEAQFKQLWKEMPWGEK
jgi:tripartite-type tricarboxylate transporter receptor subunit TctC